MNAKSAIICCSLVSSWPAAKRSRLTLTSHHHHLIQIVSALVITLGVTAGIFFNRIRLFFLNFRVSLGRLWIRLFAKRDRLPVPADRTLRTGANEKIDKVSFLWADRRSFRERLLSALPAAASLCFTFFVFGIFELYAGNLEDMTFSFGSLVGPLILIASAGTVLIALASALLRGRLFDLTLSLLLGLGLSLYVQANFLNAGLGRLTGDAVAWEEVTGKMAANLTLWTFSSCCHFWSDSLAGKPGGALLYPPDSGGHQLITAISLMRGPACEDGLTATCQAEFMKLLTATTSLSSFWTAWTSAFWTWSATTLIL